LASILVNILNRACVEHLFQTASDFWRRRPSIWTTAKQAERKKNKSYYLLALQDFDIVANTYKDVVLTEEIVENELDLKEC